MFDPSLVVQSAASSFNNLAISAPTFFWSAILMIPLFAIIYMFGNDFVARIGWTDLSNSKNRVSNFALIIETVILIYLTLMHGNYDVLRDNFSYLPIAVAAILFIITVSITQKLRAINPPIPTFWQKIKRKKLVTIAAVLILGALVGLSGMPTWWGFLIQIAAIACGAIVGMRWKRKIGPVPFTTTVIFALTAIILMQPEFFRFGALGGLTIIHLAFIFFAGILAMAIIALRNVNPRGRVHKSAYVKLKWLARFMSALAVVLFVLTESVPVFLGFCAVIFVMFAMSVWHAENIPENLSKYLWAILICTFGIMTALPIITAIGILYWVNLPRGNAWNQSKFLL